MKVRQSFYTANQFSGALSVDADFAVNMALTPIGSTLNRTWIDVRFNRFGVGTEPPELVNETGPMFWGVCFYDDAADNPGVFAEDDAVDWLWREMIAFGPAIQTPNAITGDPQWVQVAAPMTGLRDSKGQRKIRQSPAFLHWCMNRPSSFSSTPPPVYWEVAIHTLWTVL